MALITSGSVPPSGSGSGLLAMLSAKAGAKQVPGTVVRGLSLP